MPSQRRFEDKDGGTEGRRDAEAGGMGCVGMEGGAEHAEPLEAGKDRRQSSWGPGRS